MHINERQFSTKRFSTSDGTFCVVNILLISPSDTVRILQLQKKVSFYRDEFSKSAFIDKFFPEGIVGARDKTSVGRQKSSPFSSLIRTVN
jgi:hypothetical protein